MPALTLPELGSLAVQPCPRTLGQLQQAIRASGCVSAARSFERLEEAVHKTEGFLEQTLPFVWQEACRMPQTLQELPLVDGPGSLVLTQRQCLCILANAFFCTFTARLSSNCLSGPGLPSINFDELYGGYGWGAVEVEKLRMLFCYFERQRQRLTAGDQLMRPIQLCRLRAEASTPADWTRCHQHLLPLVVHPLGRSLDGEKRMIRVDFANCIVGGAALAYGCVQEEILFCICPELLVSRLYCPILSDDEAILIVGTEQFSIPGGYAGSLHFVGPYIEPTLLRPDGALDSHIVAIDALDLRQGDSARQYSIGALLRELTKVWAGFNLQEAPQVVATGNWGCGAFGGDARLKSLLQWLAVSRSGRTMHYFPWDNAVVHEELGPLAASLVARGVTVGALAGFMLDTLQAGDVYEQTRQHFVG